MGRTALDAHPEAAGPIDLDAEDSLLAALWRQVRDDLTYGLAYYPTRNTLVRAPGIDALYFLYQPLYLVWHSLTTSVDADVWRAYLLADWPTGHPLPPPPAASTSRGEYRDTFGVIVTRGVFGHGTAARAIPIYRTANGSAVALPTGRSPFLPAGARVPARPLRPAHL